MWKHVFAPTLLVIAIWIVFSGLTSCYIHWHDAAQSRLLSENVTSIRAASQMQKFVWQMEALAFDSSLDPSVRNDRLKALEGRFAESLKTAKQVALAPQEPALVEEIGRRFERFRARLHRTLSREGPEPDAATLQDSLDSADTVVEPCQNLLRINDEVIAAANRSREQLSAIVFVSRSVVLILGPALGILFGLRISRRLHRSMSEISITLKDAAGALDREVGRVNLSSNFDLPDLQRQVHAVGLRVRQVLEELHATRQEVLRSERLAAVGGLAAGIAHELRNPMTSVKLLVQSTLQRSRGSGMERPLQVVLDEIARMENTIQGLLDFARPAQLRRVPHDVRQTVQRALNLVEGRAAQQSVRLETRMCDDPLEVDGDPEQLHQVFVNLLLNALESMPAGGVLSIASASVAGNSTARIWFADTGTGIDPEIMARMFEPFVTTRERGTGLGLAISRRIVDEHSGHLWADNRPSAGAVFSVELPLQRATLPIQEGQSTGNELAAREFAENSA